MTIASLDALSLEMALLLSAIEAEGGRCAVKVDGEYRCVHVCGADESFDQQMDAVGFFRIGVCRRCANHWAWASHRYTLRGSLFAITLPKDPPSGWTIRIVDSSTGQRVTVVK